MKHTTEPVQALLDAGWGYRCGCSRADLAQVPRSPLGIIYPGTCRHRTAGAEYAIRVRTDDRPIELHARQMRRIARAAEWCHARRTRRGVPTAGVRIDLIVVRWPRRWFPRPRPWPRLTRLRGAWGSERTGRW